MLYEMKLNDQPFEQVSNDRKTIELRLFDLKRRRLDPGDITIFHRSSNEGDYVAARVKALYKYRTFEELFEEISPEQCGFIEGTSKADAVKAMRAYYSPDIEKAQGVVGIKLELINLEDAIRTREEIRNTEFDRLYPDGMK